ncbi:MAG: bifunctional (p)ppGpp synthetase/guanosine-3',5'-bis(diphosphate) 3'-pyrophosphohydrolase [Ktedonobacteraceae bacterium]
MIDRSVEQQSVEHTYSDAMAQVLTLVGRYMSSADIEQVVKAFQLACETCQGVPGTPTRPIPPLEHALAVTTILAQMMHVDTIGIGAGLVFEAVDAELLLLEQVEYALGSPTARVVESMARLNILERKKQNVLTGAMHSMQNAQPSASKKAYENREEEGGASSVDSKKPRIREAMRRQQAETVRKMFVAMADDPRVVLLKLAYRLHAMRQMCLPEYKGDRQDMLTMAEESREIYAPLAGRLGMSRVESELQDLAFQIIEPEKYNWVRTLIESESRQWRSYVERVCEMLRAEMSSIGVQAEISGRVKHIYSFYKKIARNANDEIMDLEHLKAVADISQIHDLVAFRILVATTTDCYVALGHVHGLWKPKEGRIKDFIANPKPNGYSALHTTVFCLEDQLVEIQIRTHNMHEMAEYGVAMHWHYKDVGDNASASAKELLKWLRQLAEWQHDLKVANASDAEFVEAVKDDIFQEQIFVFTPRGEVKDLPVGSTPLDFAYRIHSGIGDKCAGARIISDADHNGTGERLVTRMVSLDYELKSGEIVEIITSRSAHPTRDWLAFARTAAAKNKIRRYLKTHERPINIQIGRERLERELKVVGSRNMESVTEDAEDWVCEAMNVTSFEDLLAAVGSDDVRPRAVVVKLQEYWQQQEGDAKDSKAEEEPLNIPVSASRQTTGQLEVAGVGGLLTGLANCCNPLPDDEIVGFISRGKGVIIHRENCLNIARFRVRDRERLIHVSWAGMSQQHYQAPIVITARERTGLIRDIATVVSDIGASLMGINSKVSSNHQTVIVMATLEIDDLEQLQRLFVRMEKVKGVTQVARDLGQRKM